MTINGLLDSACVSSNIQIDYNIRLTVYPNFTWKMPHSRHFGRYFDVQKASKEISSENWSQNFDASMI